MRYGKPSIHSVSACELRPSAAPSSSRGLRAVPMFAPTTRAIWAPFCLEERNTEINGGFKRER